MRPQAALKRRARKHGKYGLGGGNLKVRVDVLPSILRFWLFGLEEPLTVVGQQFGSSADVVDELLGHLDKVRHTSLFADPIHSRAGADREEGARAWRA